MTNTANPRRIYLTTFSKGRTFTWRNGDAVLLKDDDSGKENTQ